MQLEPSKDSPLKNIKFYMPTLDQGVCDMIIKRGHTVQFNQKDYYDAVIFTGGADVLPVLYGEVTLPGTHCDIWRDMREIKVYQKIPFDRPKIGICRGGQFLNIMNGGSMYQHVDNHAIAGVHSICDIWMNDHELDVTSTHHQMMIPHRDGQVIAIANEANLLQNAENTWNRAPGNVDVEPFGIDTEVVYYDTTSTLCFQPHPENGHKECEDYFWYLFEMLFEADILKARARRDEMFAKMKEANDKKTVEEARTAYLSYKP